MKFPSIFVYLLFPLHHGLTEISVRPWLHLYFLLLISPRLWQSLIFRPILFRSPSILRVQNSLPPIFLTVARKEMGNLSRNAPVVSNIVALLFGGSILSSFLVVAPLSENYARWLSPPPGSGSS